MLSADLRKPATRLRSRNSERAAPRPDGQRVVAMILTVRHSGTSFLDINTDSLEGGHGLRVPEHMKDRVTQRMRVRIAKSIPYACKEGSSLQQEKHDGSITLVNISH